MASYDEFIDEERRRKEADAQRRSGGMGGSGMMGPRPMNAPPMASQPYGASRGEQPMMRQAMGTPDMRSAMAPPGPGGMGPSGATAPSAGFSGMPASPMFNRGAAAQPNAQALSNANANAAFQRTGAPAPAPGASTAAPAAAAAGGGGGGAMAPWMAVAMQFIDAQRQRDAIRRQGVQAAQARQAKSLGGNMAPIAAAQAMQQARQTQGGNPLAYALNPTVFMGYDQLWRGR